MQSLTAWM